MKTWHGAGERSAEPQTVLQEPLGPQSGTNTMQLSREESTLAFIFTNAISPLLVALLFNTQYE